KVARSFTVVTGHTVKNSDSFENWCHLVQADTLVILMGMRNLEKIADKLVGYGRSADTPVAVIQEATYESQQVVTSTLANIAEDAA
ncbi:MAG: uroporphyrin-III C-methyltransferase, partial [candidate division Zixibacteria bacterium]|nr:uroporphyrin-III C-methyltransferase [Gammaproteobacteria bacterium]NIR63046.1 uroporphyrin-III C-methyltransferase [candidate division Zixibacteria bacterium]NIS45058.1 uroporphyrin-III C-methyltransferase [candidate division Zixibacteria bacterium]NIV08721.1 uroporphyrin-III C-methyltransferase [candidate division Zixibacteria bacterium]NIW41051.1 uroporphyrin-III C-methyltransferase [candidate division Zixibacteria bacterium]